MQVGTLARRAVLATLGSAVLSASATAQNSDPDSIATRKAEAERLFARGVELARSPEIRLPSPGGALDGFVAPQAIAEALRLDPLSRAKRALRQALALAPDHMGAAVEFARIATASHDAGALTHVDPILMRLSDRADANAETWLALARVELELGKYAEAERAARAALTRGADSLIALGPLFRAVLAQEGREAEGTALYMHLVQRSDSARLAELYWDIENIATPAERDAWQSGDESARRNLLLHWWDLRAALAARPQAVRIAEHYRRLAVAESQFLRVSRRGAPAEDALLWLPARSRSRFDDRGLIYLRYGEPDARVNTPAYKFANESWLYRMADGSTELFNFAKLDDPFGPNNTPDWVLLGNLPCDGDYIGDRIAFVPQYRRLGSSCDALQRMQLSAEMRNHALDALERDADRPRFEKRLEFYYDLYTFRGSSGRTLVTAASAIPGNALRATPTANGVRYALRVGLTLVDTLSRSVQRVDTTLTLFTRPLRAEQSMRIPLDMQVAPSRSITHRMLAVDDAEPTTGRFAGGPHPIPDYSGSALSMSDVVIAAADGGTWRRGNVRLSMIPTAQFPAGAPFSLYYEVYNLPAGTPYTTEITIEPVNGKLKRLFGRDSKLRFTFSGTAEETAFGVQELRRLRADLKPGRYRLKVNVRNAVNGERVDAERVFEVVELPAAK